MILLVIGRVELNLSHPLEQRNIDQCYSALGPEFEKSFQVIKEVNVITSKLSNQ
jgi:hypothetical protein